MQRPHAATVLKQVTEMETITLIFVLCMTMPLATAQIELGMMNQCVDDMFANCYFKMARKVRDVYFPREIQNPPFQIAWNQAKPCAERNLDKVPNEVLTKDHLQAMCVYTNASTQMFARLNEQVRNGGEIYDTPAFQYHSLYYWLTTAIDILGTYCEITYKRSHGVYTGEVGAKMRFGYLASSSRSPYVVEYGNETCFHIKTCSGAYIGNYSVVPTEEEVLIPSFEEFRIVDIVMGSYGEFKCKKIFVLESVGFSSKINCKAFSQPPSPSPSQSTTPSHGQEVRAGFALIVVFQLLIGFLWKYGK